MPSLMHLGLWFLIAYVQWRIAKAVYRAWQARGTRRRLEVAQARERTTTRLERDVLEGESIEDMVARIEAAPVGSAEVARRWVDTALARCDCDGEGYRDDRQWKQASIVMTGPDGDQDTLHTWVPVEKAEPTEGEMRTRLIQAGHARATVIGWGERELQRQMGMLKPIR